MSFYKGVKKHMEEYRTKCHDEELKKVTAKGIYREKNDYGHILPITDPETLRLLGSIDNIKKLNLLRSYREDCWEHLKHNRVSINTYFHHLNSSQAMCINFFYPFMHDPDLLNLLMSVILKDKGVKFGTSGKAMFEYVSDYEKKTYAGDRLTNFDFYVQTDTQRFYFEIKYTEPGFAVHKDDNLDRRKKYYEMYKDKAKEVIVPASNSLNGFLAHYQIMRNLIHLKEQNNRDNYVFFVYPEENKKVKEQAENAAQLLLPVYRDKLITLSWEALYRLCKDELIKRGMYEGQIKYQLDEFASKYLS